MSNITDRFKDAPWFEKSGEEKILVVGAGGISSNAMAALTKTIPAQYFLIDNDVVEEINIGSQHFRKDQIGQSKVKACADNCHSTSVAKVHPVKAWYNNEYMPIMITGLDNMKARKQCYDKWKSEDDRELFIDARLRANLYEVYIVTPDKQEQYEETLFDDSEVDDGPCTFKQTAYFGMLCGARIAHALVNYLTNKHTGEEVCNLPFKVQEFGEPFFIDIE